jgi:hypothetical protein
MPMSSVRGDVRHQPAGSMTNVIASQGHGHLPEATAVLQTGHAARLEDLTMLTDLAPVQEEFGRPWLLREHHPRRGG